MPIGHPRFPNRRTNQALTRTEVIALVASLSVLAFLFIPWGGTYDKHYARMKCLNNLKTTGLAFRIFSTDHNDKFPMELSITNGGAMEFGIGDAISGPPVYAYFRSLSNELSAPSLLVCPSDMRRQAKDFQSLDSNTNVSYFLGFTASETQPFGLLAGDGMLTNKGLPSGILNSRFLSTNPSPILGWNKNLHDHQANAVLADGSAQQLSTKRIYETLLESLHGTNQTILLPYQPDGKW